MHPPTTPFESDPSRQPRDLTRLLTAWTGGDSEAGERLAPLIYRELRCIAAGALARERADHTLQPTDLLHEAFLRLFGPGTTHWESRAHFFASAAHTVRRLLVEHARRGSAQRRGGRRPESLDDRAEQVAEASPPQPELLEVDSALRRLQEEDAELARIVELRFFAGMSGREIAEVQGLSTATVQRRWRLARAWLYRDLQPAGPDR